jgi:hypothetical protein
MEGYNLSFGGLAAGTAEHLPCIGMELKFNSNKFNLFGKIHI